MNIKINKKTEYVLQVSDDTWGREALEYEVNLLADLFDPCGARRTGRSTKMALAFIKLALKYPNKDINLFDHYGPTNIMVKRSFLNLISGLIKSYQIHTDGQFKFDENKFTLTFMTHENGYEYTEHKNTF
jgi:hypothetical protein